MRVAFNEHNLSIIGEFVEHNRKIFDTAIHWQVEDRLCLSVELHVVLGKFPLYMNLLGRCGSDNHPGATCCEAVPALHFIIVPSASRLAPKNCT